MKPTVVLKFGGTSVGSIEKIKSVAARCIKISETGKSVVVVVSAMSGETNRLVNLAKEVIDPPHGREYDVLVSTGENVSMALLAMTIQSKGKKARSFTGGQFGMLTDTTYSNARIKEIKTNGLKRALKEENICVLAGFQGIDEYGNITTLGRGGSDTSAVALAAALEAESCQIFTDVDGIYTSDPRVCKKARRLDQISYEEMMELSSLGAKVLQLRSVEIAAKYNVPLWVYHSQTEGGGTLVTQENKNMEAVVVTGVSSSQNDAKISLRGLKQTTFPIASTIFTSLAEEEINVDMIVQNLSASGEIDLTFTVNREYLKQAKTIVESLTNKLDFRDLETAINISKVSIVGVGMRSHSGVAAKMFKTLANDNIPIQEISTSEIKVSVLIDSKYAELAVRSLHTAFGLDSQL